MHTQLPPVVAGMVVASWGPDFLMLEATGCTVHKSQCKWIVHGRRGRQESVERLGREGRRSV